MPGRHALILGEVPELADALEAYQGPNLARLTAIKHHYDHDRVFHFPQSL